MTASNPHSQPIHFQGLAKPVLDDVLKHSPSGQKLLGKALQVKEGDNGLSYVTFIQDTLVGLIPKIIVSRSTAEASESSYLELLESGLVYWALPLAGSKVFRPLFKIDELKTNAANAVGKEAKEVAMRRLHGAKAATIVSTLGAVILGGEFVINYTKNLLTAKVFKKDSFSDVVNLSKGTMTSPKDSQVVQKSKTRIKQSLIGAATLIAGGFALAKGAERSKIVTTGAEKLVKHLYFKENANKSLSLSPSQMLTFMGLSVIPYLDSARDKLERLETASRLAMILPYLAFGQSALQKLFLKVGGKYFEPMLKNGKPASIEELATKAFNEANKDHAKAAKELAVPLQRKAIYTSAPLVFGIFGTGIGVGLVNRAWTQYRFKKSQQESTAQSAPGGNQAQSLNTVSQAAPFQAAAQATAAGPYSLPFQQPFNALQQRSTTFGYGLPQLNGRLNPQPVQQPFRTSSAF